MKVAGEGSFYLVVKSVSAEGETNHKPGEPGVRQSAAVRDTAGEWKKVELEYRLADSEKGIKGICVSPRIRGKGEMLIDDVEVREKTDASKEETKVKN